VSAPCFERAPALERLGLDHGFGLRGSGDARVAQLSVATQVHGTRMLEAPCSPARAADALFARAPGLAVGVYTADCVPILLAARDGWGVAAVHAGWRGSAGEIARLAAGDLARRLGCAVRELVAALGPHIGPCCYEVDEPVRRAIPVSEVFTPGRPGHAQLDLGRLNEIHLLRAGIPAEAISRVGGCTRCDRERYESFRAGSRGRMLHYVRAGMPRDGAGA
jgi:hypothetical protein